MKNVNEIWKDIIGYEGYYQISNFGRLKSFKVVSDGKVMKLTNKNGWYFTVNLAVSGKPCKTVRIHRLVASYFVPNYSNKNVVNHIDSNKQNNHFLNLEWVTTKENNAHAYTADPSYAHNMIFKNRFITPKEISQYTLHGEYISSYPNAVEAYKSTGVCARNILQVASKSEYKKGKTRKQAGGFIWSYEHKNNILCIK